jgi:hypothetical protein
MCRSVALARIGVWEEYTSSIVKEKRTSELGTTSAVTSNCSTLLHRRMGTQNRGGGVGGEVGCRRLISGEAAKLWEIMTVAYIFDEL